ncbi:hypothetical protein ULG90_25090 [Halopseudomonas pachastrellae]|jgi:hypothetical protein|nr:hypothetical protein ULG90_25090 [Halopseudomonas pachastrellae]
MTRHSKTAKRTISTDKIYRSVASSSAIETGEASKLIETRLKTGKRRFPQLTLAS